MPMYEFRCTKCGHKFDDLLPYDYVESEVECPACHERHADRLLSRMGAIMFSNPKGTSLEDKIEYVGQWNAENAKDIRRRAEAAQQYRYNDIPDDTREGIRDVTPEELPGIGQGTDPLL